MSSSARLTIILFDSVFICSVESQFPITFFPALFLSIREGLTEHTSSVSASPCFTFTQLHTLLSWELPSTTELLSCSTGADGIKGKGCSTVALFLYFYIQHKTLKLRLLMHRFSATNGTLSVQAEH